VRNLARNLDEGICILICLPVTRQRTCYWCTLFSGWAHIACRSCNNSNFDSCLALTRQDEPSITVYNCAFICVKLINDFQYFRNCPYFGGNSDQTQKPIEEPFSCAKLNVYGFFLIFYHCNFYPAVSVMNSCLCLFRNVCGAISSEVTGIPLLCSNSFKLKIITPA